MTEGANPTSGERRFCDDCDGAYLRVSVLPVGWGLNYCPTCMEEYMDD